MTSREMNSSKMVKLVDLDTSRLILQDPIKRGSGVKAFFDIQIKQLNEKDEISYTQTLNFPFKNAFISIKKSLRPNNISSEMWNYIQNNIITDINEYNIKKGIRPILCIPLMNDSDSDIIKILDQIDGLITADIKKFKMIKNVDTFNGLSIKTEDGNRMIFINLSTKFITSDGKMINPTKFNDVRDMTIFDWGNLYRKLIHGFIQIRLDNIKVIAGKIYTSISTNQVFISHLEDRIIENDDKTNEVVGLNEYLYSLS